MRQVRPTTDCGAFSTFAKANNGVNRSGILARIRANGGRNADLVRLGGLPVKDEFEFV